MMYFHVVIMLLALVGCNISTGPPGTIATGSIGPPTGSIGPPQVVFSWDKVGVAWPNATMRRQHGRKAVNVIGVKVWKASVYLTVPRWHGNGHPLNVAKLARPEGNDATVRSPLLEPFPSWEMQVLGDCSAFQFVQSMEVEQDGTMWMPDNGREKRSRVSRGCSPKLVLMDLTTGSVIHIHEFPTSVVPRQGSFLNDITLNVENDEDKFAYISDSDRGRLVVFSLKKNKSWVVTHSSMRADLTAATFQFLNPPKRIRISDNHINGLVMSPAKEGQGHLYYSPLTSIKLFRLNTAAINSEEMAQPEDIGKAITEVGIKNSQTDGLAMDESGRLYMQEITNNALNMWDIKTSWNPTRIWQDNETMIWIDTFTLDEEGWLWFTSRGWPIDSSPKILRVFV